jgi:hypothetical protein
MYQESVETFVKKHGIKCKPAIALCEVLIRQTRRDPIIGRGSLSVIDECWSDEEILEFLCCNSEDSNRIKPVFPTPRAARSALVAIHRHYLEREQECIHA